jgi:hypothetical protein
MPTDAHLYPHHKPKNTPKELSSSTSLAFTSTLTSLLSSSSSNSRTNGRPRPSKNKNDIFTSHNKNSKKRAARDLEEDDEDGGRGRMRARHDIGGVDDAVLHRSKRKMEEKTKIYNAMKRGGLGADGEGADELIDFDRKWAEQEVKGQLSDSDIESDDGQGSIVEYDDEYGRARRGTRAEAERMQRRKMNKVIGAEELDRMSARPAMPSNLIYGDTVQTEAFRPEEEVVDKMEEIARKRDRSLTPPEMKHYEADKEFRIKGVGFYSFSKDEKLRGKEMEALEKERLDTEKVRRERVEKTEARKREIEERRRAIGEKRAKKQADNFLDSLTPDLVGK